MTTQVLGEFYLGPSPASSSITAPESVAFAGLERYAATMRVLDMRVPVIFEAARARPALLPLLLRRQIWASARLEGIDVVLSEDFASGTEIEGVRFVDPFAPGFALEQLFGG